MAIMEELRSQRQPEKIRSRAQEKKLTLDVQGNTSFIFQVRKSGC
jgi:hypothetical protein